jgi:Protein of unknown function (DUF1615)
MSARTVNVSAKWARSAARSRLFLALALSVALTMVLTACATDEPVPTRSTQSPAEARAMIGKALPASATDRNGWATDIYAALAAMQIAASVPNVCAIVAVAEQESTFRANPSVPGMAAIAWREIDAKAERAGIPKLVVHAALQLESPNGKSYSQRIDAASTEKDLSDVYEDFIDIAPMGKKLFAGYNPVRTAGPMQVSIAYAEQHVKVRPYPYPITANIRAEVFSRRGGMYFGIAHLLDYAANYDKMVYRFADFNAGHYASRNAAFQNAVSVASGIPLELDGDLIVHGSAAGTRLGTTETAVRALAARLGMTNETIRAGLEQEQDPQFHRSKLYERVLALADQANGRPVPRAVLPKIQLKSPKITRNLTTEWFANRVDERSKACIARISGA